METIKSMYKELAQNYLASKEREARYCIYYPHELCPEMNLVEEHPFTSEEISQLKALREKYGKGDFVRHLDEIFDAETLYDIDSEEIIDIEIDSPVYCYKFVCHNITDDGVYKQPLKIELSDDTYIKLLELHLWDKNMNINILKFIDESLYQIVSSKIDDTFRDEMGMYSVTHPFAVTMDELQEDAQKIREQQPDKIKKVFGTRCYNSDYPYHEEL